MNKYVIAIDGPCASGKGTMALKVAKELGFDYLDSGSLYRVVAYYVKKNNLDKTNEDLIAKSIADMKLKFENTDVFLDGENVNDEIRKEDVGLLASEISQYKKVRDALLDFQRNFAQKSLVCDGRDMTSMVFPNADVKIYMTALAEVRAKRRCLQLGLDPQGADYRKILDDILTRDRRDMTRDVAPLVQVDDAFVVDTTYITIEEAVDKILGIFYKNHILNKTA